MHLAGLSALGWLSLCLHRHCSVSFFIMFVYVQIFLFFFLFCFSFLNFYVKNLFSLFTFTNSESEKRIDHHWTNGFRIYVWLDLFFVAKRELFVCLSACLPRFGICRLRITMCNKYVHGKDARCSFISVFVSLSLSSWLLISLFIESWKGTITEGLEILTTKCKMRPINFILIFFNNRNENNGRPTLK